MRDDINYKRDRAIRLVKQAVRDGDLTKPDNCELCGCEPGYRVVVKRKVGEVRQSLIHAHHWNGYDDPLNVWWLCFRCNGRLIGRRFHIGEFSREEAIAFLFGNL